MISNLEHFLCVAENSSIFSRMMRVGNRPFQRDGTDELRDPKFVDQCREIVNRDAWRNKIASRAERSEDPMIFDEGRYRSTAEFEN